MFKLERNLQINSCDWTSLYISLKKYVTKSSNNLEIGASNFERTKQISCLCHKLIGVEYMPERKQKNFGNTEFILGDCHKLSSLFAPEYFDAVVASHVIEHLQDDKKALDEIYYVLKPKGVVLLNTPNRRRLTRLFIEFFFGRRKFPFKEHVREYTEQDLLSLIELSKFKKFKIIPRVFGLHGGPIRFYLEKVPNKLRKYANFWEIHLFK